jgi:sterol 14-demethylase
MQPVSVIFPYLPIPAHRRRDRARQRLREMFGTIIRARKASGRSEEDMLQCLIDYRYKNDGRPTTEDEIAGLLITVLFGAQKTSSITYVHLDRGLPVPVPTPPGGCSGGAGGGHEASWMQDRP